MLMVVCFYIETKYNRHRMVLLVHDYHMISVIHNTHPNVYAICALQHFYWLFCCNVYISVAVHMELANTLCINKHDINIHLSSL